MATRRPPYARVDRLAVVATRLAGYPTRLVPLAALRPCVSEDDRDAADAVLAALDQLAAARLIIVVHGLPRRVGVLDPDGLRAVALTPPDPGPVLIGE